MFGLEIAAGDHAHGFVRLDTGECSLCLHAAREHLREHDVEMGEIRSPAPGTRICDGRDPEGNPFSIESREESDHRYQTDR